LSLKKTIFPPSAFAKAMALEEDMQAAQAKTNDLSAFVCPLANGGKRRNFYLVKIIDTHGLTNILLGICFSVPSASLRTSIS